MFYCTHFSEPVYYIVCDLAYKSQRNVGQPKKDEMLKIIKRYKIVGYSMAIMRQSVCMVVPITVYGNGFLFKCTMGDEASDSMTALR